MLCDPKLIVYHLLLLSYCAHNLCRLAHTVLFSALHAAGCFNQNYMSVACQHNNPHRIYTSAFAMPTLFHPHSISVHTHICTLQQPPALMLLQARTDELRIQKRFLNDMFARVKQEYLERRLRQQQIEQMLGHKGNLAALPSTSAQEAGPSNALALRPADSAALADQADASPGQSNFSCASCLDWEISELCCWS